MWRVRSSWTRVRAPGLVAAAALLMLAAHVGAVSAEDVGQGAAAAQPRPGLKASVEARFSVFAVRNGIILVPRTARPTVASIELSDGTVAINGALVTGAELRQRLGADADLVAELTYLEPGLRRALFVGAGVPAEPAVPGVPVPPVPDVAPAGEPPARPEVTPERRFARTSDTKVRIGRSVRVDRDESVRGAIVVIGGSADVDGEVEDALVVVGGNARLGPEARIRGDVTIVGGTLDRAPGAAVDGEVHEITIGVPPIRIRTPRFDPQFWRFPWMLSDWVAPSVNLFATLVRFGLVTLLAALVLVVAGGAVDNIQRTVTAEPWKAGLVGLVVELLTLPVLVLTVVILVISILGIPLLLLLPFVLLAMAVGLLIGFTGVASSVGAWARRRFGWSVDSRIVLLVVGLLLLWSFTLLGRIVGLGGWSVWVLSVVLLGAGFLVEYVAWTIGLGGLLLSRFGTRMPRSARRSEVEAPLPPLPSDDVVAEEPPTG